MLYRQGGEATAGMISVGLRQRFDVFEESGERRFEVPDDLDAGAHERLLDAGHTPLEPERLPDGVTYDPESGESGSSGGSDSGTTEEASSGEESEEPTSGSESGSMTADRMTGEAETPEPPKPLDEMNRSELYQYGNEELNLGLAWSGDEALNEEEMRDRISGEV